MAWVDDAFMANSAAAGATQLQLPAAWNIYAGIQHYWVPNLRTPLYGGYVIIARTAPPSTRWSASQMDLAPAVRIGRPGRSDHYRHIRSAPHSPARSGNAPRPRPIGRGSSLYVTVEVTYVNGNETNNFHRGSHILRAGKRSAAGLAGSLNSVPSFSGAKVRPA